MSDCMFVNGHHTKRLTRGSSLASALQIYVYVRKHVGLWSLIETKLFTKSYLCNNKFQLIRYLKNIFNVTCYRSGGGDAGGRGPRGRGGRGAGAGPPACTPAHSCALVYTVCCASAGPVTPHTAHQFYYPQLLRDFLRMCSYYVYLTVECCK